MIHLSDGLLLVLEYGIGIFCFVDVLRAAEPAVPWMPRWGWVLAILIFPLAGGIGWLVATHPWRERIRAQGSRADAGTDQAGAEPGETVVRRARAGHFGSLEEDAALLAQLWDVNEEHERTLRRWEEDLRRREAVLRMSTVRDTRHRHMDAA